MKAIERIVEIIDNRGLKYSAVEKAMGLSNGYLNTMSKRNGNLGEDILLKFCKYLDVSLDFLLTGVENSLIANEPPTEYNLKQQTHKIPLIPINAIAGAFNGSDTSILSIDCVYYDVPEFNNKADYLIRITGSSMSPKYHSGDIVACKKLPISTFFQWNKVYVIDTEQGPLIKRVKKSDIGEDHILLISENDKYDPFDIPKTSINALGLVIGVIRLE